MTILINIMGLQGEVSMIQNSIYDQTVSLVQIQQTHRFSYFLSSVFGFFFVVVITTFVTALLKVFVIIEVIVPEFNSTCWGICCKLQLDLWNYDSMYWRVHWKNEITVLSNVCIIARFERMIKYILEFSQNFEKKEYIT